jgi:RNA polymerase sigma-70 factor (ECF subfamily)
MNESVGGLGEDIVRLLPRLRRFAQAITCNADDADDLVQLAVERALQAAGQWQPGTRLDSWLFRIMKNLWIDELRARRRRDRLFAPESAGEQVGQSYTDAQIERMSVQKAMEQLSDDQRLAISLVLVEGLQYKEAAAVLDIPIGTLTSRLARGREVLQAILMERQEPLT